MGDSGDRAQSDLLSAAKATWSTPWPAAAMASRTIPVENLSSIKILFVLLANLAHGVLAQGTTAEPRIDYQNQVNRAISCFLLLSPPNSCRNLKKWGPSRPFFETAPLFRSSSSLESSVALVLFSSSPSLPSPYVFSSECSCSPYVLSSERDLALLDIVHLCRHHCHPQSGIFQAKKWREESRIKRPF